MCLEWDSNPHCTDFEAVSSTSWDTEASFATELSFSVAARFPGRQRLPPIHHNIAISWRRPAASPFARSGARKTFPATAGNREWMANPADGLQTPAARPDTTRKREPMPMEIHRQSDPWRPSPFHEESRATVLDTRRFQAEKPVLRPRDLGSFPRFSSTRNTATGSDAAGARRRPVCHGRAVSRSDAPLDPGDSLRPCERRRRSGRRRG